MRILDAVEWGGVWREGFSGECTFTAEGVPQALAHWVEGLQLSRLQFLLLVNLLFLVRGCFLDVSVLLLAMTVFPQIVLRLPQTMGYGAKK